MRWSVAVGLGVLVLFSSAVGAANFYKWVDDKGVTHYSAEPPPTGREGQTLEVDPNHNVTPFAPAPDLGEAAPSRAPQKRVVMYSAAWCGVCKRARAYFKAQKVKFTEFDVEQSTQGRKAFQRLGGRGVPLILIGEQRMVGFDPARFEQMLKN